MAGGGCVAGGNIPPVELSMYQLFQVGMGGGGNGGVSVATPLSFLVM